MCVPTSEVGYTAAMPRREDHEVHKDMWWHWGGGHCNYMPTKEPCAVGCVYNKADNLLSVRLLRSVDW